MHVGNLLVFDYDEFAVFENAIGEILLRKVLHNSGINQSELIFDFDSEDYRLPESGIDVTRKVFALLGYVFGEPNERQFQRAMENFRRYYYVDISLPELNGCSAQKLNPNRARWEKCLIETRFSKPDYEVKVRTDRARRSVLRFKFDEDSGRGLFFQLPTLIENFLHWREDVTEVLNSDSSKRQKR